MMPPCPWTMAFGAPVVPEPYSTYSGWSNSATATPTTRPAASTGDAADAQVSAGWYYRSAITRKFCVTHGLRGLGCARRPGGGRGERSGEARMPGDAFGDAHW
jgi:hypothetical protein